MKLGRQLYESNAIIISILISIGILGWIACRKIDQSDDTLPIKADGAVTHKFFNANRSGDPTEKAIVNFIRSKNKTENFVEKTVAQIGYPRWDKIMSTTSNRRIKTESDTVNIFYVPFVRDSQNYVNASMLISASPNDTSFRYLCD